MLQVKYTDKTSCSLYPTRQSFACDGQAGVHLCSKSLSSCAIKPACCFSCCLSFPKSSCSLLTSLSCSETIFFSLVTSVFSFRLRSWQMTTLQVKVACDILPVSLACEQCIVKFQQNCNSVTENMSAVSCGEQHIYQAPFKRSNAGTGMSLWHATLICVIFSKLQQQHSMK